MKRSHLFVLLIGGVALVALIAGVFMFKGDPSPAQAADPVPPEQWSTQTRQDLREAHEAAAQYLETGQHAKAAIIVDKLLKDHPLDAQAHVLKAQLLLNDRKHNEAYGHFLAALEIDPKQDQVSFSAGVVAYKLGLYEEARDHYARATVLNPQDARYPLFLGQILLKLNELDQAQLQLLQALKLNSQLPEAYSMLAELAGRQGKLGMAIEQVDKAARLTPPGSEDRTVYLIQKAQFLRRDNRPEEALNVLLALPPKQQVQTAVIREQAMSRLMLGQPNQAAELWATLFTEQPTNVEAATQAGQCFLRAGEMRRAKFYLSLAQRVDRSHPSVKALESAVSKQEKS